MATARRAAALAVALGLAVGVAACGQEDRRPARTADDPLPQAATTVAPSGDSSVEDSEAAGERPPPGLPSEPATPELAGPVPLAVSDGVRPVTGVDTADPFVAVDRGVAWAFTTNTGYGNVPVTGRAGTSDVLPELPSWAVAGRTWAPAVARTDEGWVLAFTAHHAASGRQCIGVATAERVSGPYTPHPAPLACDLAEGGSIDPSFVRTDAGLRLLYKVDGNCCGRPTPLRSALLTSDGTAIAGPTTTLAVADRPWEQGLVEAPTMTWVDGRWLLLYSAGAWQTAGYTVGAAWCRSPAGGCTKLEGPVLASTGALSGPGGLEVVPGAVTTDGSPLVAFHAWPGAATLDRGGIARQLYLGRLAVAGDSVTVIPVVAAALL